MRTLILSLAIASFTLHASIPEAELHMQAREYDQALTKLKAWFLLANTPNHDYTAYLAGLASYHSDDDPGVLEWTAHFEDKFADSAWARKARFLRAKALIRQRKHEAANAIYEAEALRLFDPARKEKHAQLLVDLADELSREPDPKDPAAPPANYAQARTLYQQVLGMAIGRGLEDNVRFKVAGVLTKLQDWNAAQKAYRDYLAKFDPTWAGSVGSPDRFQGKLPADPEPAGAHRLDARFRLAEVQLSLCGQRIIVTPGHRHQAIQNPSNAVSVLPTLQVARKNLQDLIALLLAEDQARAAPKDAGSALIGDARWTLVRTYNLPHPAPGELDAGIDAIRAFTGKHPRHPRATDASRLIATTYQNAGRIDDAISAFADFAAAKNFTFVPEDGETDPKIKTGVSCAETFSKWTKEAVFMIGQLRFNQRDYPAAISQWERYIARFPNGEHWSQCQGGIINAEFQIGIDAVSAKDYPTARRHFEVFLKEHPLDARSRQILFILGQMHVATDDYAAAIADWARLISKYPNTEESSLALFRTAQLQEKELANFDQALASYLRLKWGSRASKAKQRVDTLTAHKLAIETERTFRSNETAQVKLAVRNVEKVTVRQYFLDLEAYFRKTHRMDQVELLDVDLIEPDATWEVEIADFTKYAPLEQQLAIPFPENQPGVCIIKVSEEDFEATTLVVRSDIDLIVKSSRKETLVFAQNRLRNAPAGGASVLFSDGKKIIGSGSTGQDGVLRKTFESLRKQSDIRVFVSTGHGVASNILSLSGLNLNASLATKGYIYPHNSAYRPGETVQLRAIVRDTAEGRYTVPVGRKMKVQIKDPQGRVIQQRDIPLSDFGTLADTVELPGQIALGSYTVTLSDGTNIFNGNFQVQRYKLEKMKASLDFSQPVYFRGEPVVATIGLRYYWDAPVPNTEVTYSLPDGRKFTERTDAEGQIKLTYDASGYLPGSWLNFSVQVPGENVQTQGAAMLAVRGFEIQVKPQQDVALVGEPVAISFTTTDAAGEPTARDFEVEVLRLVIPPKDPVLQEVPWLDNSVQTTGDERKVATHKVGTNAEGHGSLSLRLDDGGRYILRAKGKDRFDQTVTSHGELRISDDADEIRLRFFADKPTVQVGETLPIRLHSRVPDGFALITYQGETIISHDVRQIKKGFNPLSLAVGHDHFPNFRVEVTMLDGRELRTSHKDFRVERELRVQVIPAKPSFAPGETAEFAIEARDQLDKPVEAELSLALVNAALFELYADDRTPILSYFQNEQWRVSEFRATSNADFAYAGATKEVEKSAQEEQERQERAGRERQRLQEAQQGGYGYSFNTPAQSQPQMAQQELAQQLNDVQVTVGGQFFANGSIQLDSLSANFDAPHPVGGGGFGGGGGTAAKPRMIEAAARWLPAIRTNAQGKATVSVELPDSIGEWRVTSIGVTTETLVGETKASVITRKPFFLELKLPTIVQEGDQLRILATVHADAEIAGEATVTLNDQTRKVSIADGQPAELLFDAITVPNAATLRLAAKATLGDHSDAIQQDLPIRAWGLPMSTRIGGVASASLRQDITLPSDREYRWRTLDIAISPTLEKAVLRMAKANSGYAAADLLAVVAGIDYAKDRDTDTTAMFAEARRLTLELLSSQRKDGHWLVNEGGNAYKTADAYHALVRARALGIIVPADALSKAEAGLRSSFSRLSSNDNENKTHLQFGLAANKQADFSAVNRLYRERSRLSALALARLGNIFLGLDRREIAKELLALAAPKLDGNLHASALTLSLYAALQPDAKEAATLADTLLAGHGCFRFLEPRTHGHATAALAAHFGPGRDAQTDLQLIVFVNDTQVALDLTGSGNFVIPTDLIKDSNQIRIEVAGAGRFAWAATLTGFSPEMKNPKSFRSRIEWRRYYHDNLTYGNRRLKANSSSIVKNLPVGEQVRVYVDTYNYTTYKEPWIWEEYFPLGTTLVPGSIKPGSAKRYEVGDGKITFYLPTGSLRDIEYRLVAYAPGTYRVLPSVIRSRFQPQRMIVGPTSELTILAPGEDSPDPYSMNTSEHFELARLNFDDKNYDTALEHLNVLFKTKNRPYEKDVARMLLWIHTSEGYFDAAKIVQMFEILRERHPDLTIPFDRILVVGRAYREIGEFERAWLVFRASIDGSFVRDTSISATLEDHNQFLASMAYLRALWREYPDRADIVAAKLAWANALFTESVNADTHRKLARPTPLLSKETIDKIDRVSMLADSAAMTHQFLTLFPEDPQADDAAFAMLNSLFALEDYPRVVGSGTRYVANFAKSDFRTSFEYMAALGHFWQYHYEDALGLALEVARGESKDRDFARYITAQIYHTQGNPAEAIEWYEKVRQAYPDAAQSIDYFEEQKIAMDEVHTFTPGEDVSLELDYRNIKEAFLQIYKVDLMKLYLREKNLSNITKVRLAGISPELEQRIQLGNGKDYADKMRQVQLDLKDEGAYLVIVRGDDLFTSGLVLITPLRLEIQEDAGAGSIRVNVRDRETGRYIPKVHVKAIGSADSDFRAGDTDLRGIFATDGLNGLPTVIARAEDSRYAFYRGEHSLGNANRNNAPRQQQRGQATQQLELNDYLKNATDLNIFNNGQQIKGWDSLRRSGKGGVQIKKAR
jgi:alpha-2-macroglobulin